MALRVMFIALSLAVLAVLVTCAPVDNSEENEQRVLLIPVEALQEAESQDQETAESRDLDTAASHHYDTHGHLDKGAYTGHHGSFGWYAHYPVGHH